MVGLPGQQIPITSLTGTNFQSGATVTLMKAGQSEYYGDKCGCSVSND